MDTFGNEIEGSNLVTKRSWLNPILSVYSDPQSPKNNPFIFQSVFGLLFHW